MIPELPNSAFVTARPETWYAIRVNANCERRTAAALASKGYESYFPTCWQFRYWAKRSRRVERAMIPGYVFARFDPEKRLPILTIPGIAYVIGTRSGPTPVDPEELEVIRRIAESSSTAEPWPYLAVGQTVLLEAGPLRGLRGKLVSVSSHLKVIVSISLLQRSVAVEVDRGWVRRSDEHEWVPSPGAI